MFNGWGHLYAGKPEPALARFERARRLSPVEPIDGTFLGLATSHLHLGNLEEALAWAEKGYAINLKNPSILRTLAQCAAYSGRVRRAKDIVAELLGLYPDSTLSNVQEFYTHRIPWQRKEDVDLMIEGLRRAGLPNELDRPSH